MSWSTILKAVLTGTAAIYWPGTISFYISFFTYTFKVMFIPYAAWKPVEKDVRGQYWLLKATLLGGMARMPMKDGVVKEIPLNTIFLRFCGLECEVTSFSLKAVSNEE